MKNKLKKILNIFRRKKDLRINFTFSNEQFFLKDKNVVITGGTSGIGYDIARRATELGANVLIVGRNEEQLKTIKKELNCKTVRLDITNISSIHKAVEEIISMLDYKIDCLINNAGVYDNSGCTETTEEIFDKIINTNLKGTYFFTKEFILQNFLKAEKGNIIFISSNRAIFGDDCVYGISKSGIVNFTRGLAKKYLEKNIRVNSIAPGMTTSGINGIKDTDNLYRKALKGKRVLSSKEIAEIAMFLISDASMCITGQTIICDNGESIL